LLPLSKRKDKKWFAETKKIADELIFSPDDARPIAKLIYSWKESRNTQRAKTSFPRPRRQEESRGEQVLDAKRTNLAKFLREGAITEANIATGDSSLNFNGNRGFSCCCYN